MPQKHIQKDPAGDKYKEELVNAEHGMRGDTMGITAKITFVIALCWSLFQMASASFLLLDSVFVKAIHLGFAILLVYLNIPMLKPSPSSRWDLRILLAMNRVTVMDYILGIIAAVVLVLAFVLIGMYNGMIRGRNMAEEAWSGIDVQLKRRHDLIPNLVNTVQGYASHEREALQAVTR